MKLSIQLVKAALPSEVHMTYGWRDVLQTALSSEGGVEKIDCADDVSQKAEFVAVYKLVRVDKIR